MDSFIHVDSLYTSVEKWEKKEVINCLSEGKGTVSDFLWDPLFYDVKKVNIMNRKERKLGKLVI